MQINRFLTAVVVMLAFAFSTDSHAQTQANQVLYVQLNQLSVENYPALVEAFKNRTDITLSESCIPAKVISVKASSTLPAQEAYQRITQAIAPKGFSSVLNLTDFNDQLFMERCSSARFQN